MKLNDKHSAAFRKRRWKVVAVYVQGKKCELQNKQSKRTPDLSFSCSVFCIFNKLSTNLAAVTLFFLRNIVCARYHRKTWIQAVCALCTHPSFSQSASHNPNASRSNFAFKSCGLTQRGSFLPHTSSEKRENQKDTKSRLAIQWGENSFCHCCHCMWDYRGDPRPMLPLHPSCMPSLIVCVPA